MALHESAEMYLETIYQLSLERPAVRSIDVAEALNYSRPSVSRAVGLLKQDGYLETDADGFLVLTELGKHTAQNIYERHTLLSTVLMELGVDPQTAAEDACRIEHVISEKTLDAIRAHIQKYNKERVAE
jgi:Mn-dependent DtxR family transcriptional regulator